MGWNKTADKASISNTRATSMRIGSKETDKFRAKNTANIAHAFSMIKFYDRTKYRKFNFSFVPMKWLNGE